MLAAVLPACTLGAFSFSRHVFEPRPEPWDLLYGPIIDGSLTGSVVVDYVTARIHQEWASALSAQESYSGVDTSVNTNSFTFVTPHQWIRFLSNDIFWFVHQDMPCSRCTEIHFDEILKTLSPQHERVIALISEILERLRLHSDLTQFNIGLDIFITNTWNKRAHVQRCCKCDKRYGTYMDENIWKFTDIWYILSGF